MKMTAREEVREGGGVSGVSGVGGVGGVGGVPSILRRLSPRSDLMMRVLGECLIVKQNPEVIPTPPV